MIQGVRFYTAKSSYARYVSQITCSEIFMIKISVIFFLLLTNYSFGQEEYDKSIYLELFGNGGLYSVNIEKSILEPINARIGYSYFLYGTLIPIMLNYFDFKDGIKPEVGIGIVIGDVKTIFTRKFLDKEKWSVGFTGTLGLRIHNDDGGFIKIAYTPFLFPNKTNHFFGFSIGERF